MKINKYIKLSLLSLIFAMGLSSCVGDLNIQPIDPSTVQQFNEPEVFSKVYASWSLSGQEGPAGNNDIDIDDEGRFSLYRTLWVSQQLPTDETVCAWGDIEVVTMNRSSFTSTNPALKGLYARLYFVVTIANHYLSQTEGNNDAEIAKKRAEVRYLRALAYYYLMDVFGNVPFTTTISSEAPKQIQRADLFAWIETEVKELEPNMYEPKSAPYYRLDKAAAWLLLSRMYLNSQVYTGSPRWNDAAVYAKKVMDSGYSLANKYKYLFMADNAGAIDGSSVNNAPNEIIFPIAADGVKTKSYGSSIFIINSTRTDGMLTWGTTGGWGGNRARYSLMKKFFPDGNVPASKDLTVQAKDERALFFSEDRSVIISDVTKFKEGVSVQKFWNLRADGGATHDKEFPDMDIPFMRAAEAYLTYAEAVTRGASPIGGYSALQAVNKLRSRANAKELTSVDLQTILDEKSREFFFEGQRRTDLIRYNYFTGGDYNWDWKGGVSNGTTLPSYLNLMPLPADDLNANSENLKQNPGY